MKSQKILDSAIGTFDDFLRASFITADSLNGLLSQDESEFLDALLRDSGMEIFEKKMEA
jgi:DNA-binding ferritin-like protein (Dps family)